MLGAQAITETPKRNILGEVTNSFHDSPTANLKLLTNVALKNVSHRKDKSLRILCDRFLELYPLYGSPQGLEIHLDSTALKLGVERRRIYDIINILEALQCATHCRKNTYSWHGASKLTMFLDTLKCQGEKLGVSHALHGRKGALPSPKHRSLGTLAQRFLMMFLVEPEKLINLEMAVSVLISTPQADRHHKQHKSKVRRLYDISNVLTSIGLIEKVSGSTILKKPVFRYAGLSNISKKVCTPPFSSIQMTPISLITDDKVMVHSCPSRSKRKLVFPSSQEVTSLDICMTTPPSTPSHKWKEILLVADMELTRLNGVSAYNISPKF